MEATENTSAPSASGEASRARSQQAGVARARSPAIFKTLRRDIEAALSRRSTQPDTQARLVEDAAKRGGASVWSGLKRHSYVGMLAIGGLGVLVADLVGVGELAFGVAAAYGAFRVLKRGEAPEEAVEAVLSEVGHL